MIRRIIEKGGLLVFGFLLAFLFGEILLRFLGYSSGIYRIDKETKISTLKPAASFYWTKSCFKNKIKTNSFGFHSKEYSFEKPAGVYRIVVLGDSYVEALQVPLEETFSYLLEKQLNNLPEKEYNYEVIPIGHAGNGTYLNILYLQEYGLRYSPDLVINAFLVGNDFRDDSLELSKKHVKQIKDDDCLDKPMPRNIEKDEDLNFDLSVWQSRKTFLRDLVRKSVLAVTIVRKYQNSKSNSLISKPMEKEIDLENIPLDNQVYLRKYPKMWIRVWKNEELLLEKMKQKADNSKSKFMIVSLTEGFRVHDKLLKERKYLNNESMFDLDKPEKVLTKIAERRNFPYLALLPIFRERAQKENKMTVFSCDGHWNEVGHEWASEAIFEFLLENRELIDR